MKKPEPKQSKTMALEDMTLDQRKFVCQIMTESLVQLAGVSDARHFRAFLTGLFSNVVGNVPLEYFEAMTETGPCGTPNCQCHEFSKEHIEFLKFMRSVFVKVIGERDSSQQQFGA